MSTISVSTQSELLSALRTATGGDTIQLAAGNYGNIALNGTKPATRYLKYSGEVKIVSANPGDKAVVNKLFMEGVQNLTFENIEFDYTSATTSNGQPVLLKSSKGITFRNSVFDGETAGGYGSGTGLKVSAGRDILVENSTFTNYRKGIEAWAVDGFDILNNKLQDISYDGIVSGHVQDLTIRGNTVAMRPNLGADNHRDVIQVYNQGSKAPSSNVLIENNKLTSTDTVTHGIYMGNADAKSTGSGSEFYSNVVIRGNVIQTGQKLGIGIGHVNGLKITGNTLIQNDALNDNTRPITIPMLQVEQASTNVTITDNVLHGQPIPSNSGNWAAVNGGGAGWNVRDNAVVKLDWKIGQSTADPWADVRGNGEANQFRYKGTWVSNSDKTDVNSNLNFEEGDTIVLVNYERNSFKGVSSGNKLDVNSTGDYAKINSIVDLQELAATSPKLSASVSGDTLTLHITQTGGVHDIVLEGLGQEYQSTYDASLF